MIFAKAPARHSPELEAMAGGQKQKNTENKKTQKASSVFMFFVFLSLCAFSLPTQPVQAFSVSPVRQTVVIDPGHEQTVHLTVENSAADSLYVQGGVEAFTVDKKTGRAVFGATDPAIHWVKVGPEQLSVPPHSQGQIFFTITVPVGAEPGGHYLGFFIRSVPKSGQITIGSQVDSLFFLYVGGQMHESLVREDFSADHGWYLSLPVHLFLTLRNVGTIHAVPTGQIILRSMNGREITRVPLNVNNKKVLPGGVWQEEYLLRQLRFRDIGKITATAGITYGITGQHITDLITFWYVPIWLIVSGGAVGVLLIIGLILGRRKLI